MKLSRSPLNKKNLCQQYWRRCTLLGIIILVILCVIFHQTLYRYYLQAKQKIFIEVLSFAEEHGFVKNRVIVQRPGQSVSLEKKLWQAFLRAPIVWWQANDAKLPEFKLDIKFAYAMKLQHEREIAIKKGVLLNSNKDFVPAVLTINNQKKIPVRVRLKGDLTDHIASDKYSLRVKVRGEHAVFGMRQFSLQNPARRDVMGPLIFTATLRAIGSTVIAPTFRYVKLDINGQSFGIMALEEHFTKSLLANNHRTEGVIIKFNEEKLWQYLIMENKHNLIVDNYYNAVISCFSEDAVMTSPVLRREFFLAVGLLRGFIHHKLKASQVFDSKLMGEYLATADLWGSIHALRWNNMRFYFNPVTAKLEPIVFDVELDQSLPATMMPTLSFVNETPAIARDILGDKKLYQAFLLAGKKYYYVLKNGSLVNHLKKVQQYYLKEIGREFYLFRPFDFNSLYQQAVCILDQSKCYVGSFVTLDESLIKMSNNQAMNDHPVNVFRYDENGQHVIEVNNLLLMPTTLFSITAKDLDFATIPLDLKPAKLLPTVLPAAQIKKVPSALFFTYKSQNPNEIIASVQANNNNEKNNKMQRSHIINVKAIPYAPIMTKPAIPSSDLDNMLKMNSFIKINDKEIIINKGTYQVTGNIIIPENYHFVINAGVTLNFSPHEKIISYGDLQFKGNSDEPIFLQAKTDWDGIVVFNANKISHWSYVEVNNTSGVKNGAWQLRGGVTFYQSSFDGQHCTFSNNKAEDALNIVKSEFSLKYSHFDHTVSDAFDADFAQGEIINSEFSAIGSNSGGDAIDVSGTKINVSHTSMTNIRDKAISIGEHSEATISHLKVQDSLFGVVSKDLSTITISMSDLQNIKFYAFMAYIKKPVYGPAKINADSITLKNIGQDAIAQIGSSIMLNGKKIIPSDLDVKKFYQTEMKSDKPI